MNESDIPKVCAACGCKEMDVYVRLETWAVYQDGKFSWVDSEQGGGIDVLEILKVECPRCES